VAANLPLGMLGGGGDIATGAGRVWVRGNDVLLATIDPARNEVETVYGPPAGSGAVRVAEDLVWVTAHDTNTVWVLRA
jgi:streptogramin lyase